MDWILRYASHLGYRSAEQPLFLHSVGSPDPVAHVHYAADLGFAGVQDVWAAARPVETQRAIAGAMEARGLEGGCVAYTARENIRQPLWATAGAAARERLLADLAQAIEAARRINSRLIVILSGARPEVPRAFQLAALVEHLKWAAPVAAQAGVVLCLEPINARQVPGMLLHHIDDAYAAARAVDSPAVKLIFDTAHVQAMDGDLLANLEAVWSEVALIQLADNPGRLEPGAGELNFANILKAVRARGYAGLIELEHGWSSPDRACEQRGLEHLRALDAQLEPRG